MYCTNCDYSKALKPRTLTEYRYSESGLDNIVLLDGVTECECPKCHETYLSFGDAVALHALIAETLITKDGLLTGQEIRFLRTHVGYSGAYFAKVMGYKPETISRIENSKQAVTVTFDRHVRTTVGNKVADRDYDLHEKILNPPTKSKTMKMRMKKSKWSVALPKETEVFA